MSWIRFAWLLVVIVAGTCETWAADMTASPIGKEVDNFSLPDFHGKTHSLDAFKDRVVVLAFLGTQCPLAKNYAPRLRDLAAEFDKQGVAFLGIDANLQDSLSDIGAFARINAITFPLLKDNNNELADRLGALRTPEVFLLDRGHVIRYWGRIDDQYGLTTKAAYVRSKLTDRSLADAITEVLAGHEVTHSVTKAEGCFIGRVVTVTPHGDVTYSRQIARIMQHRCVQCHRPGEVAPFSLTSYDEVVGWAATIREVVQVGRMPPWFADPRYGHWANDARLGDEEKHQICEWVDNGCPQGDLHELPEPRTFVDGWQIGAPDQVVYISVQPVVVPAEGLVEYRYFTVDPGWKVDKWIAATEMRPGCRAVVHHMKVDVQPKNLGDAYPRGEAIGGYIPGRAPNVWPAGIGIHVPANSKLVFQVHYTPNGIEQFDRSMIGIRFADPQTIKKIVRSTDVEQRNFKIPAGDPNYEVKSQHLFYEDTLLLSLAPHMHFRGKSFRYEAAYPDGTREVLLDVPHYEFNWQLLYDFSEPKLMPKGTMLQCTAHFDNSPDNLANPDPAKNVTYGEQTWDEMMEGHFVSINRNQDLACIALVALSVTAAAEAEHGSRAGGESQPPPPPAALPPTQRDRD
ncbi:MAG TPA: redoxin domain-containing protein [Pirellulales bacterium]|nr:redoxin domain-containing protein [Pirellulales bacterium]